MKLPARCAAACISLASALALHAGDAPAQVAGEIRGRVTDAATAQPIANGRVEVGGRTAPIRTTVNGAYVVRGLEPGTYTVVVRALGYASFTRDVQVVNGRSTALDAALTAKVAMLADVQVQSRRDTTALNTTEIDRTRIEQSGQRDLGELLQTAPGVVVTQSGGPGQASSISIRGSSSNQVLVLIDGVPLNSAIAGSADLSRVPLELVEHITVRTGAQSARYGPRAMAGVIEIETRKLKREASTLLKTGALGERDASIALGYKIPVSQIALGASLAGDFRTVDGDFSYTLPALRGGGRATRINSDATTKQLLAGVSLDGTSGSAALRASWQRTARGLAGTIIQPSSSGRQGHERSSGGGSAQGVVRRVAWSLAADVTHEMGTFIDESPPFGQAFDDTVSATGITASGSVSTTMHALSTSVGAELRTLDIRSTMLAAGAPHWQQLLGGWGNARYTYAVTSSVQLDADISARVDRNSLSDDVAFSPRGALRLSRGIVSTSVSLGSGYTPPTLSDQFFNEGVQVRANPTLQPERTRRDLEGRVTVRETRVAALTFSGEAAAFRSNIDGMILWLPDFRFIWSPNNFHVNRSGWELNGKIGLTAAHLAVQGTLNRNDITYAGNALSGQVAYRPRNSVNFNVAFAPSALRVDVRSRYIGARRTIAGSGLNTLTPYWMSDVRLSSSFTKRNWTYTPTVSAENVFNRAAAMLVDYPFPPRTWSLSLRVRRYTNPSP